MAWQAVSEDFTAAPGMATRYTITSSNKTAPVLRWFRSIEFRRKVIGIRDRDSGEGQRQRDTHPAHGRAVRQ